MTIEMFNDTPIWSYLLHLGYNMWADHDNVEPVPVVEHDNGYNDSLVEVNAKPYVRMEDRVLHQIVSHMSKCGINMAIVELGEAVQYRTHPELAVKGAWSVDKLKKLLTTLRSKGIEPIPKLNFSAAHDHWLGPFSRCVSTDAYYRACGELIDEVCEIFSNPRFFHLGMDEEDADTQIGLDMNYVVIRRNGLWWKDLYFFIDQVEKNNCRPWVYSDYYWNHQENFLKKMPRNVVQSNWFYGSEFDVSEIAVKTYIDLANHGYDQIPVGSNHRSDTNFANMVDFCMKNIPSANLLGFMQTTWRPLLENYCSNHLEALIQVRKTNRNISKKTVLSSDWEV